MRCTNEQQCSVSKDITWLGNNRETGVVVGPVKVQALYAMIVNSCDLHPVGDKQMPQRTKGFM